MNVPAPLVRHLGLVEYLPTEQLMKEFTLNRTLDTSDEWWLVEHPPVFTQGQAGKPEHLLLPTEIPMIQTERGGQITYHGPGQVVVYMMLDLKRRGMMVREWVHRIEGAIIAVLLSYGIDGVRKDGAPGIYIGHGRHEGAKIAALGLKVKKGCTYHGLSFNVNMDLNPFSQINPCGYAGLETVDMKTMGVSATWSEVADRLAEALTAQWQSSTDLA